MRNLSLIQIHLRQTYSSILLITLSLFFLNVYGCRGFGIEQSELDKQNALISKQLSPSRTQKKCINRICYSNGKLSILLESEIKTLIVATREFTDISFPKGWQPLDLDSSEGTIFFLGQKNSQIAVFQFKDKKWEIITKPLFVSSLKNEFNLKVQNKTPFLISKSSIHYYSNFKWSSLNFLTLSESLELNSMPQSLFVNKNLYLAFDEGEFEGALLKCDLLQGKISDIYSHQAVTSLTKDTNDQVWFTTGMEQMGSIYGGLYTVKSNAVTEFSAVSGWLFDNSQTSNFGYKTDSSTNWNLQPTAFRAILFSQSQQPVLYADSIGFLLYDKKNWKKGLSSEKLGMVKSIVDLDEDGFIFLNLQNQLFHINRELTSYEEILI